MLCLLCSVSFFEFLLFLHQFWGEDIIYFKSPFYSEDSRNCWRGTELWTVQTSSSEQSPLKRDGTAMEALLTHVQRQWKHFRITGAGRGLREHLIQSLHFTDKMKTREMKRLAQSHTADIQFRTIFQKYHMVANGAWFLWGWRTIRATFIKHLFCTRHLTRCYWRYKDRWDSAYESPVRSCFSIFLGRN